MIERSGKSYYYINELQKLDLTDDAIETIVSITRSFADGTIKMPIQALVQARTIPADKIKDVFSLMVEYKWLFQ